MPAFITSLLAPCGRGASPADVAGRLLRWLLALALVFGLAAADVPVVAADTGGAEYCESLDPCGDAAESLADVEAKAAARHGAPQWGALSRGAAAVPCAPASLLRAPPERPPVLSL